MAVSLIFENPGATAHILERLLEPCYLTTHKHLSALPPTLLPIVCQLVLGKYIHLLLIIAIPQSKEQREPRLCQAKCCLFLYVFLGDAVPPLPPTVHRLAQRNHCLVTIHNTDISFSYFRCKELTTIFFKERKWLLPVLWGVEVVKWMHSNTYSANTNTAGEKINQARAGSKNICHREKWLRRAKKPEWWTHNGTGIKKWSRLSGLMSLVLSAAAYHIIQSFQTEQGYGSNTVIIWDVTADW